MDSNEATRSLSQLSPTRTAADVNAVKAIVGRLKSDMEAAGYDLAKLPPSSARAVLSPDLMSPVARLAAFAQKAC